MFRLPKLLMAAALLVMVAGIGLAVAQPGSLGGNDDQSAAPTTGNIDNRDIDNRDIDNRDELDHDPHVGEHLDEHDGHLGRHHVDGAGRGVDHDHRAGLGTGGERCCPGVRHVRRVGQHRR